MRSYPNTLAWWVRAQQSTVSGSQTASKAWDRYIVGATPGCISHGKGAHVWDIDGHEFIDWQCGLGAATIGYAHPAVVEAVRVQHEKGAIFPLPSELEDRVSRQLCAALKWPETVKWFKTGSEACAAAVRAARRVTSRDLIVTTECYDTETEVLTARGFCRFTDLTPADMVATLNAFTFEIEYQHPTRIIREHYCGEMVRFCNTSIDLLVTPNHDIFRAFVQADGQRVYRCEPAINTIRRKGSSGGVVMVATGKWRGSNPDRVTIPSCRVQAKRPKPSRTNEGHPTKGVVSFPVKSFMRFMGFFLAEGYRLQAKRKTKYEVHIAQTRGPVYDRIAATIEELGFKVRRCERKLEFASKELWHYLAACGDGALNKRVPRELMGYSAEALQELYEALIDGDGTRSAGGSKCTFYSTSRALASDVQELALKLGMVARVYKRNNGNGPIGGKAVKSRNHIYHVSVIKPDSCRIVPGVQLSQVRAEQYDGDVVCVTVPNHLIYVRRNGKPVWCGNSSYGGWHDWTIARTACHPGVPEVMTGLITTFPYNDVAALERILVERRVAAVMLEPTLVEPPMLGFLQEARRLAHEYGALYIHDNMILGGRAAVGGGDELLHVQPDLSVFGKAIGGGLPLACVVGSHDLMQMTDTCSGTFGGDCLALAACEATLELYRTEPLIDRLWTAGRAMLDGLQQAVEYYDGLPAVVKGYPFRPVLAWTHSDAWYLRSLFVQEAADRGVLMHPAGFLPSAAATHEDVRESVMACQEALAVVATALKKHDWRERLRGEPYREAFTRPEVKATI